MATKPKPKPKKAPLAPLAQRVKADPALLQRALADPGLRSKLPDRYLSPTQRKARSLRKFRGDIGDISTPLEGDSMMRVAEILAGRDYDQTIRALDSEAASTEKRRATRSSQVGGMYDQLLDLARSQAGAAPGATRAAVDQTAAVGDAALRAVEADATGAQAQAAQDAAVRGGALAENANDGAATKNRIIEGQAATKANAQAMGDAMAAVLAGAASAGAQRKTAALSDIDRAAADTLTKIGDEKINAAERREGAFTELLLRLRGDAVDQKVTQDTLRSKDEQAVIAAKVELAKVNSNEALKKWEARLEAKLKREGYTSAEAIATAKEAGSGRRAALAARTSRENNRATNAQSDANNRRTNESKGGNSFTPTERRRSAKKRDSIIPLVQRGLAQKMPRAKLIQTIQSQFPEDGTLIRVVVKALDKRQKLTGADLKKLENQYGITLPRRYR